MVSLIDIDRAANVLASALPVSPLLRYGGALPLNAPPLFLKAESLMPTGSFKIRGATYAVACLTAAQRRAGVVAYSTGNHAQAVAKAAHDAGIEATIVMSDDVPPSKLDATLRWGAKVVMSEATSAARRKMAESLAEQQGLALIAPYDNERVIAGQGTIGLEIMRQLGGVHPAAVFVPVGGGGLIAGVATALRATAPSVSVIGVEPELEDDARRSLRSGAIEFNAGPSSSCADAIRVQGLGHLTFDVIKRHVADIVTVSETEILDSIRQCFEVHRLVVEGAGAVALAAARRHAMQGTADRPLVAVLSGGNLTAGELGRICARDC